MAQLHDKCQVVICFQISIFEPLETIGTLAGRGVTVVICFQISIFEPLETIASGVGMPSKSCDLLSN